MAHAYTCAISRSAPRPQHDGVRPAQPPYSSWLLDMKTEAATSGWTRVISTPALTNKRLADAEPMRPPVECTHSKARFRSLVRDTLWLDGVGCLTCVRAGHGLHQAACTTARGSVPTTGQEARQAPKQCSAAQLHKHTDHTEPPSRNQACQRTREAEAAGGHDSGWLAALLDTALLLAAAAARVYGGLKLQSEASAGDPEVQTNFRDHNAGVVHLVCDKVGAVLDVLRLREASGRSAGEWQL